MSVIHQFEKILSDSRAVYEKAAGGDRDHGQTGAGKFFVTEETGPGTGRDANILALGERVTGVGLAEMIVDVWLHTEFAGGRHERRVEKIMALEAEG